MEKNRLEIQYLTAADYKDNPFEKVILPLGSLESHGPHMPFGTDAFTAWLLAKELAERVENTAVLPPVTYGMSEHYRDFPFTVSLTFETEIALIRDILESLHREGIRKVFILNGHDGNIAPIEVAARSVKVAHPEMRIVSLGAWWETLADLLPPDFFEVWGGLGHGGEGELSMGLALFPELCRPDLARGVVPDHLPPYAEVKWLFKELTDSGASGDPTRASREKGLHMKEVLMGALEELFLHLDSCDWDYRSGCLKK
ncbi:MAG TPA: creatininase family protein [Methanoregulaceae archaeon]|nr:creatininase family protein [Methanoregulaceae archaeon]